jgi:hypothetical protein
MIALLLALFITPAHEAQTVPEALILTPGMEAIWVPEGTVGPIVAAPFTVEVFEAGDE